MKMRNFCSRRVTLLGCLASLALFAGCDSTPKGRIPVYPTQGSLTVNGEPAAGALLTFFGQGESLKGRGAPVPMATVQEDGTFRVTSYGNFDGAPAGAFNVTVVWPEPTPEDADPEFYEAPDRLAGKYSDPKKAPLSVTIKKGTNQLEPFRL